ncbi:ankyrin repeat domain-containing protein 31-like isoform X4 [Entelurus aequoreus]|uniref:ankyrin repeat domain-containing protein 31-like isoform X4 n=1 Tax=Entelurus aequoreus TaxID=161455 RepID=UPI002B1DBAF7|nr:ankyrin repeat domain-containing protein 31-like isoform X4 [Entelurus aequoreus]
MYTRICNEHFISGTEVTKENKDMFNPINSSLPSGETTGGCNKEHDNNSDGSSDEDSISLLHDLNTIQSKEGMQHCGLILATNSKESKNMMAISQLQVAEYAVDDADNANDSQNGNMHKEIQLYETDENEDAVPHKTCRVDEACGEVLTQAGDIVNLENIAALHKASAEGNVEGVQELFNADGDINAVSNDYDTPLLDCVSSGHQQGVNIVFQYGSQPNTRNTLGFTALDVADQMENKELFNKSSTSQTQPDTLSGELSAEAHSNKLPPCHSSFSCTSNLEPRELDNGNRTDKPAGIPLRKNDTATDNTARQMLASVEKKQKEISTWSLTQPQDGVVFVCSCFPVIYLSAITNIQNELAEIFVKQQLEKDNLVHKYKSMTSPILQHGVKIKFLSLCSRQRKLVNILQMQMNQMTEMKKGSQDKLIPKRGTQKSTRRANPQKRLAQTKDKVLTVLPGLFLPAHRQDHSYLLKIIQANNVQTKYIYPPSQGRAKEHSKHLSQLIQKGLIPHGGVLQIFLKGKWHSAHVQGNGSIKDSKGKSHLFPECWLQSILANNIPVSSTYAWDKVMFQNKTLSYLFKKLTEESTSETDVQHNSHGFNQETLTPVPGLNPLMAIRTVYLVADEELIPNAIIDSYWKRLLQKDFPQF